MRKLFSCVVLSIVAAAASAKGDAKLGKKKAATCASCHGKNGISLVPTYPNLACQKSSYLVDQLKKFKSGARKGPLMVSILKPLSDKDFEHIAEYYSTLPFCKAYNKNK